MNKDSHTYQAAHIDEVRETLRSFLEELADVVSDFEQFDWKEQLGLIGEYWRRGFSPLIKLPPGSGKSHIATGVVNRLYEEHGLPSLFITLTHDVEDAVPGRENWRSWLGHGRFNCEKAAEQSVLQDKYYQRGVTCDCGYDAQFTNDRPTITALEYIQINQWDALYRAESFDANPLKMEVYGFPLWIVDEIDFGRFVKRMNVGLRDLEQVADTHPNEDVKQLSEDMRLLLAKYSASKGKTWGGHELYRELEKVLQEHDDELSKLAYRISSISSIRQTPWIRDLPQDSLPANFPPYLLPILSREIVRYLQGEEFNPRIHIRSQYGNPVLHILWKTPAVERFPVVVMDATADAELVKKAFTNIDTHMNSVEMDIPLPQHVRVLQRVDDRLGMSTLGLFPGNKGLSSRTEKYKDAAEDLNRLDISEDATIGLVTFKDIEDEAREEIKSLGFENVKSLYFGKLRSMNDLQDVDVLILLGCPAPADDRFIEEAQAFFWNDKPLNVTPRQGNEILPLRDGREIHVESRGFYYDDRLQSYYRQKCQMELYQAVYRSRPLTRDESKPQLILIYTNMPIPGLLVDGFLGWEGRCVEGLRRILADKEECSVPELAREIMLPDEKFGTVERRIRRDAGRLANYADVSWISLIKRFQTTG